MRSQQLQSMGYSATRPAYLYGAIIYQHGLIDHVLRHAASDTRADKDAWPQTRLDTVFAVVQVTKRPRHC